MKNLLLIVVTITVLLINQSHGIPPILKSLPLNESPSPGGFWKTRSEWKAYWVKDWLVKKVYVPTWKRVWGPTEVKEWVPTGVAKPAPSINTWQHRSY